MGMKQKTNRGYFFDELTSCLQKSIRRGVEKDALRAAIELEYEYPFFLWDRITVIAHEDIGIADMEAVKFVEVCRAAYFRRAVRRESEGLFLANAILALCRAKKSRIGDDFAIVMYREAFDEVPFEIPEYALDRHTGKGRAKGLKGLPGAEFFITTSAKLENESTEVVNIYKEQSDKNVRAALDNGYRRRNLNIATCKAEITSIDMVMNPLLMDSDQED